MYITYQNFPDHTANSLQTISNINNFVELGVEIELIFPLRKKDNSDISKTSKSFYSVERIYLHLLVSNINTHLEKLISSINSFFI